jgi:drug/metabolite transporter (DMT)-like permease
MRTVKGKTPIAVHGALLAVSLLFGANYVVAKFALREIRPSGLVVIRAWGTAAILFAASMLHRPAQGREPIRASEFGQLFLYSLLGVSINQLCFLAGLDRSTATNASIMLVSIPVLTHAFAVVLGRERPSLAAGAGIALGLAGALLLIIPRGGIDFSSRTTIGNVLLLTGGCSYGLYLVLTRDILARHDPLRVISWTFVLAAVTVLPFGARDASRLFSGTITRTGWISIAFVVVAATVLPYLLNVWALARVESSFVAIYVLVQPLFAATLGRIVLHERFGPHIAAAAALVVSGVVVSTFGPRALVARAAAT